MPEHARAQREGWAKLYRKENEGGQEKGTCDTQARKGAGEGYGLSAKCYSMAALPLARTGTLAALSAASVSAACAPRLPAPPPH